VRVISLLLFKFITAGLSTKLCALEEEDMFCGIRRAEALPGLAWISLTTTHICFFKWIRAQVSIL